LPAGCEYTLTNGPVVFSDVVGSGGGNTHTVTITGFTITLGPSNSLVVTLAATDQKNTSPPTTTSFNLVPTVSETDTTQSSTPIQDNATTNFSITSLLLTAAGAEIRLDPADLASDTGSMTVTDLGSGSFNISSFFDVFVDLSLDGTFGGTTNGLPNSSNPAEIALVLVNAPVSVPEPPSFALLCAGLLGLCFAPWVIWQRARAPTS
jgi:hypothetical protein